MGVNRPQACRNEPRPLPIRKGLSDVLEMEQSASELDMFGEDYP